MPEFAIHTAFYAGGDDYFIGQRVSRAVPERQQCCNDGEHDDGYDFFHGYLFLYRSKLTVNIITPYHLFCQALFIPSLNDNTHYIGVFEHF